MVLGANALFEAGLANRAAIPHGAAFCQVRGID